MNDTDGTPAQRAWSVPQLETLDVMKTFGGIVPNAAEDLPFVAQNGSGRAVFGQDS